MHVSRPFFRDEQEMLRTTARRFLERECVPMQSEWDRAGCVDRETWLKAGRESILCPTPPTEYPVARAFGDSRVMRIYGGTSEVMRDLISRKL
jgi:alkylation response protein AidB-like acyl-CoA dehydrogenase